MQNAGTAYRIKEGQDSFAFTMGLPSPYDYGIIALPSWNTTVWLTEKTSNGFVLRFGTPCPSGGGKLYLTIHTSIRPTTIRQARIVKEENAQPKYSKRTRDQIART